MTIAVSSWLVPAVVAVFVSIVVVRLIERYGRRCGLIDLPNNRSLHVEPTPRGGGLGIWAGTIAGLAAACVLGLHLDRPAQIVFAVAAIIAATGFWDDLRGLGVWPRLAVQTAAAAWLVWMLGGLDRLPLPAPASVALGWAGAAIAVVWIVGVTNFVNFMDGADGLAAGQGVVSLVWFAWMLWPRPSAWTALCVAAATAGFLTRNWSPARVFLGDVGSAGLGALLASLPWTAAAPVRPSLVFGAAVGLALFLFDPLATLARRMALGLPVGVAHREHAYQRLIAPGMRHARVVAPLLVMGAVLSWLAAGVVGHPARGWLALAAAIAAFAWEWRAAQRASPVSSDTR